MRISKSSTAITLLIAIAMGARALNGVNIEPPSCSKRCMVDSMFKTKCLDVNCLCHDESYQTSLFQCLYSQCDAPDYGPALLHSVQTCLAAGAEIHMSGTTQVDMEFLHAREVEYLAGRELPEVPGLELRQDSAGGQGFGWTTTTWVTEIATVTTGGLIVTVVTPFTAPTGQSGGDDGNAGGGGGLGPIGPIATVTNTILATTTVGGGAFAPSSSIPNLGSQNAGPIAVTSFQNLNNTATPTRPWMVTASETVERHRPSFVGLLLWAAAMLALDIYFNAH
ncbi:hypothetical protein BJ170DRAFT_685943 [Xylariales sp. AK1849]|nr:hypothetical protein BJ170DRAFT_685943 [Xylariales sp. AK1849]